MKVEFESMDISVIIPLYNKKDCIIGALNSVFRQTHPPSEIIVVNDGSTDGSELLVKSLCHPLIQLVNQKNAGVSAARNKGIELARCKWVAFLDADDYWDDKYLQAIKELHGNYPSAKVLATNYRYKLHNGEFKATILKHINYGDKSHGILNNYFELAASSSPPICSSAVVVDRESILKINGFPVDIESGEDLICWARLAVNFTIAYSRRPLATFVLHKAHNYEDVPNRIPQIPDFVGREFVKLKYANPEIIGMDKYISSWHKMRAQIFLRFGKRSNCIMEIFKSLKNNFLNFKVYIYILFICFPTTFTNWVFKTLKKK